MVNAIRSAEREKMDIAPIIATTGCDSRRGGRAFTASRSAGPRHGIRQFCDTSRPPGTFVPSPFSLGVFAVDWRGEPRASVGGRSARHRRVRTRGAACVRINDAWRSAAAGSAGMAGRRCGWRVPKASTAASTSAASCSRGPAMATAQTGASTIRVRTSICRFDSLS